MLLLVFIDFTFSVVFYSFAIFVLSKICDRTNLMLMKVIFVFIYIFFFFCRWVCTKYMIWWISAKLIKIANKSCYAQVNFITYDRKLSEWADFFSSVFFSNSDVIFRISWHRQQCTEFICYLIEMVEWNKVIWIKWTQKFIKSFNN